MQTTDKCIKYKSIDAMELYIFLFQYISVHIVNHKTRHSKMSIEYYWTAIVNDSNFSKTSEKGSDSGCYLSELRHIYQNSHTHTPLSI